MMKTRQTLTISDQELQKYDAHTYPLGLAISTRYPEVSLFKPFQRRVSLTTELKNDRGHSGLLILGWGGTGKTALANSLARKAQLTGNQIIRYYQHEKEQINDGSRNFTEAQAFTMALSQLIHAEPQPTLVIIDSLEAFLQEGSVELSVLLTVKSQLEKRLNENVMFVIVFKSDYKSDVFNTLRSHVAMTVTGRIHAHYGIEPLWDRTSSPNLFYLVNELRTGEFVVLTKEQSIFRCYNN